MPSLTHHMKTGGLKRFLKYSSVGFGTFLLDLILLYVLVELFEYNYLVSTGLAFLIAVSINYIISRKIVFSETTRGFAAGYLNFIGLALTGMTLTILGMSLLVSVFGIHYLIARCLVSGAVGIVNYTCNLIFNFKIPKAVR